MEKVNWLGSQNKLTQYLPKDRGTPKFPHLLLREYSTHPLCQCWLLIRGKEVEWQILSRYGRAAVAGENLSIFQYSLLPELNAFQLEKQI